MSDHRDLDRKQPVRVYIQVSARIVGADTRRSEDVR